MTLRTYFDIGLRTTVIFALLGAVVGYISFLVNSTPFAFVLMIIVGVVSAFLMKKIMKISEEWKWWFGNGIVIYIFMWLIMWTIFYNLAIR